MTGEDRKNYRRIVSRRWMEIKEDLERLSAYNDRARQINNEAEKPAKLGDNLSVGSIEQKKLTVRLVVKER